MKEIGNHKSKTRCWRGVVRPPRVWSRGGYTRDRGDVGLKV